MVSVGDTGTLVTTGDQAGAGHGDTHTWSPGHHRGLETWRDHTLHTEQLTPIASPVTAHYRAKTLHYGCNMGPVLDTHDDRNILKMYKIYRSRYIHIVCVELKSVTCHL